MNIHIIVAMTAEAKYMIQKLGLHEVTTNEDFLVYHKEFENKFVRLFVNKKTDKIDNFGTVQAALLTYKSIQFIRPDFIFNIGTCGGIQKHSVDLFNVICAKDFVIYHDRYIGEEFIKNRCGFFKCIDYSSVFPDFKHGIIGTSNSIIITPKSWELIDKFHVKCVDMEAAAIAEVAQEFGIPFSTLKVVTDLVSENKITDTGAEFRTNFHKAMSFVSEKLELLLSAY